MSPDAVQDPKRARAAPAARDIAEHEFWHSDPKYSAPPPAFSERPPRRPAPSRVRVVLARLLFVILFSLAVAPLVCLIALKFGIHWSTVHAEFVVLRHAVIH